MSILPLRQVQVKQKIAQLIMKKSPRMGLISFVWFTELTLKGGLRLLR